ncbi:V-type proton ATPase subunit S1 [Zeugodacus cucurbitae]|uniref:V-type proton ATPase subunit S1 n=1 Tax=Zeugodacus cucurbitae TaxID=28588 RepID=UPI0023D939DF|nr:V-type proton ATPase subunit S1 [Zeugodacus cucurbitae]
MQTYFIAFLMLSVLANAVHCGPVFIWNSEVQPKSVFPRIKQSEFLEVIKPLQETKMIAAFLYSTLAFRYFRCGSCFPFLSQQTPAFFYANVERPEKALSSLNVTAHLKANSDGSLETHLVCEPGKLYLISLNELKRSSNSLKSCDDAIKKITTATNCAEAAYMFMGTKDELVEPIGHLYQHHQFSFHFSQFQVHTADGLDTIQLQGMNVSGMDPVLTVEFKANNSDTALTFNVLLSNGYFEIKAFKYNETQYYVTDLYAPQTSSYACGKIELHNDKEAIILRRVQMQYDKDKRIADFRFKDPWTCEAFTSPAIISGLFVAAILISILSVGVGMLMSVQAPTKYDSALGQNLYINVTE